MSDEEIERDEAETLDRDWKRWRNRDQSIGSGPGYRMHQRSRQSKARR